jgi:hypothetical protein
MMNSAVYQQSSNIQPSEDRDQLASTADRLPNTNHINASQRDPENRLLWRFNPRRLDFEALRDSLLAVTDELDTKMGGPAVELHQTPFSKRRTVYGKIDRKFLPGMFRAFDFVLGARLETIPQDSVDARVSHLYELALQRRPTLTQQNQAREFLRNCWADNQAKGDGGASVKAEIAQPLAAWEQFAQVLLLSNEFMFVD